MSKGKLWLKLAEELLFPAAPLCLWCRRYPAGMAACVCRACLTEVAFHWQRLDAGAASAFAAGTYTGLLREVIHRLKYAGDYQAGRALGQILGLAIREEPRLADASLIVPTPLHYRRLEKRGFNHAAVLADGIIEVWRRPISSAIIRQRETLPQSSLSAARRQSNMRGAFAVLQPGLLAGVHVLVVDDIFTTGATFLQLRRELKRHGARVSGVFAAYSEKG